VPGFLLNPNASTFVIHAAAWYTFTKKIDGKLSMRCSTYRRDSTPEGAPVFVESSKKLLCDKNSR
jgi:hypothetical protein